MNVSENMPNCVQLNTPCSVFTVYRVCKDQCKRNSAVLLKLSCMQETTRATAVECECECRRQKEKKTEEEGERQRGGERKRECV